MTASKLDQLNQLRQAIHNLRMRFPIGIKSITDAHDAKLDRLQKLLELQTKGVNHESKKQKRNANT
jgi:hypothetical protein